MPAQQQEQCGIGAYSPCSVANAAQKPVPAQPCLHNMVSLLLELCSTRVYSRAVQHKQNRGQRAPVCVQHLAGSRFLLLLAVL